METIAFYLGAWTVSWRTVLIGLGVLSFVLMLTALRLAQGRRLFPVLAALPFAAAAALWLGRLIHWYCLSEDYASFGAAMTDLGSGGFSLIGTLAAALLAAAALRLIGAEKDIRALLDDAAAAGALGIAAGRLGERFGSADRGKILIETESLKRLPFSAPVIHPVSGAEEWRFATFCAQSLWAFFLFLVLTVRLAALSRKAPDLREEKKGNGFLLFLTLYCEGQILLDSTRYDALFLRSNGFVSLEQILCCAVLTVLLAALSVRGIRAGGKRGRYLLSWALFLAGFGLVGYMEYYVQRHGGAFALAYGLMAAGLAVVFAAERIAGVSPKELPGEEEASAGDPPSEEETADGQAPAAEAPPDEEAAAGEEPSAETAAPETCAPEETADETPVEEEVSAGEAPADIPEKLT